MPVTDFSVLMNPWAFPAHHGECASRLSVKRYPLQRSDPKFGALSPSTGPDNLTAEVTALQTTKQLRAAVSSSNQLDGPHNYSSTWSLIRRKTAIWHLSLFEVITEMQSLVCSNLSSLSRLKEHNRDPPVLQSGHRHPSSGFVSRKITLLHQEDRFTLILCRVAAYRSKQTCGNHQDGGFKCVKDSKY